MREYASGLISTPKAEIFCSCKFKKFIGQNKVKICKLQSQNFEFLGQKIGCSSYKCNISLGVDCHRLLVVVLEPEWSNDAMFGDGNPGSALHRV